MPASLLNTKSLKHQQTAKLIASNVAAMISFDEKSKISELDELDRSILVVWAYE